jgi:hypothetical protein
MNTSSVIFAFKYADSMSMVAILSRRVAIDHVLIEAAINAKRRLKTATMDGRELSSDTS